MTKSYKDKICQHNSSFWDQEALDQKPWSQPVSQDIIAAAKQGEWAIQITKKPLVTHLASYFKNQIKSTCIIKYEDE